MGQPANEVWTALRAGLSASGAVLQAGCCKQPQSPSDCPTSSASCVFSSMLVLSPGMLQRPVEDAAALPCAGLSSRPGTAAELQQPVNTTPDTFVLGAGSLSGSGHPKPRMGNITLKMLLDEGLVLSGDNNLVSEYKGVTQLASLRPDGRIACMVGACCALVWDTVYQIHHIGPRHRLSSTCGQLLPCRGTVDAAC